MPIPTIPTPLSQILGTSVEAVEGMITKTPNQVIAELLADPHISEHDAITAIQNLFVGRMDEAFYCCKNWRGIPMVVPAGGGTPVITDYAHLFGLKYQELRL